MPNSSHHTATIPLRRITWVESPWSARSFWIVVAGSLLLRVLALWAARHAPFASDAQEYTAMARQLLGGQPFVPYWPPGVPLYLVPFVAIGASDMVLRASILVFWLIACWSLLRLMRALGAGGIAWLVLLIFGLLPDSIQMAIEPMTQMPAAALLLLAAGSAVRLLRGAPTSEYLLLGASLGYLSLVRPSALPLVFLMPLACALVTRRFYPAIASALVAFIMVGAWVQHTRAMTGRWIINTANQVNLYYGNNPWTPLYRTWYFGSHAKLGTDEIKDFPEYEHTIEAISQLPQVDRPAAFEHLTVLYVRQHPVLFLDRTANRVRCFFGFDTFTSANLTGKLWLGMHIFRAALLLEALTYLLLTGFAVFWIAQAPGAFWREPAHLLLLAVMAIYAAPYWITMSHPTYHFPVLLPLAALGASAWRSSRPASSLALRVKPRAWLSVAALLLIQVEWVWQMSHSFGTLRDGSRLHRLVAEAFDEKHLICRADRRTPRVRRAAEFQLPWP